MTFARSGIRRLFQLDTWRSHRAERDLHDEIETHITLRSEQLERAGMPASEARDEAERLFATSDTTINDLRLAALDRNRYMRTRERLEVVWEDTCYAARRLMREPMITAFILCTLALGIGINVTAFSVVDRVLLRGPEGVRDPSRLVRLYSRTSKPPLGEKTSPWLPYAALTAWRSGMKTIVGIGAYSLNDAMLGSGTSARMRRLSPVSSNMFGLLGVRPATGRFFGPDDDEAKVVVLADGYWKSEFGGNSSAVGMAVSVDGIPYTVVGIAPAGYTGVELGRVDAWIPISQAMREHQNMQIVARLQPGVSVEAAVADIDRLRAGVESSLPKWASWLKGAHYIAAPIGYDESARESVEGVTATWLGAISAMILLISCANVANVLLARLARRRQELAVRTALGAGRARVVRLLVLEGFLLASSSAVLALAVIVLIEPLVQTRLFPAGAWEFTLVDARVLGAVGLLTSLTAMLVAAAPAIQASRVSVGDALRGGARGGEGKSWVRPGLTIVQAMLSVVLLIGAGLFLRSLQRVNAVPLGMDPDRVLRIQIRYHRVPGLPGQSFDSASRLERARHRALVEVARQVPGVEDAAVSVGLPLAGSVTVGVWVPGRDSFPPLPGGGPYVTAVSPDYFGTMGTAMRQGRGFAATDREGSEAVAVIGESMARALWPARGAVGQCIVIETRTGPCTRVVGVAADVHRSGLREEPSMQFYVPIGQERGFSGSYLLVRPQGAVSTSWPALREALQRADPSIQAVDMRVMAQGLDVEMRPFRLGMAAFGLSAGIALIVAGLGLYSVMAHAVAWRRHEIGVRMALGARPASIATLVVSRGTLFATLGVGGGLMIAILARQWLEPHLFQTSATDPLVFIGAVVVIEVVALLASWIPARRAMAMSPTEALRAE